VDAFVETLEQGLEKNGQEIVSLRLNTEDEGPPSLPPIRPEQARASSRRPPDSVADNARALDSQAMLPAYVFGWPSGNETGSYLAVDLGGTNLRVCLVELEGNGKFEVTQTKFRL